jgi:exopolysaccharide/PEP-CTERM locus tyrosine autokinase
MDLIEQAAKRLEELRRAGIDVPAAHGDTVGARGTVRQEIRHPAPDVGQAALQSRTIELDMEELAARNIITPNGARTLLADEMRVIKRPLLNNVDGKSAAPVKDANLIMITSAVPGEGKTYTSINLAMSIAMELDHTVLLVDADVARPSIPKVLGMRHEKGLLDVLLDDKIELNQVLLRTNVEKLSILPAGTQHPRATELLASDAMNNLLADMAQRYSDRVIIFDSPPLLATTEARALASHMGQVVLVVKAASTSHAEVRGAVNAISACPVKMVMLNQATGSIEGGYGYGGYGYGYGYGRDASHSAEPQATS